MIEFLRHGYGWFDTTRTIGPHSWPHFDLLYIHSGQIEMQLLQRQNVTIKAPQAILIYPQTHFTGRPITHACRASVQHFMLRGRGSLPQPLQRLRGRTASFDLFNSRLCRAAEPDIARAIGLAAFASTPMIYDLRSALLTLILAQLSGAVPQYASHSIEDFATLTPWLMENLAEPISIDQMAEHVGLSPSHFRSRFSQAAGMSPARYLRQLRAQEAQRLLRDTMLPIKRIAQLVGYPELPHLHRLFITHVGETPASYRAKYANIC